MSRFNRYLLITIHEMSGPEVVGIYKDLQIDTSGIEYQINASVEKSLNNSMDAATVAIQNPPFIKRWYEENREIMDDMSKKDFRLSIATGYEVDGNLETWLVFVGTIYDYSIQAGNGITDHTFTVKANSGQRAMNRSKFQTIFETGTTYRQMIETIFQSYIAEFGGILGTIYDPEEKLETELLKPETVDFNAWQTLGDLVNEVDFVFGKDRHYWWAGPKTGVFTPDPFDDVDIRKIDYKTGKTGLISFDRSQYSFSHRPDERIQIGVPLEVSDYPQINVIQPFEGRVNRIAMNLGDTGDNSYAIQAQYRIEDKAIMPDRRTNEPGALLL